MTVDDHLPQPGFVAQGQLIGGGLSGIVELLPNGHVVKTLWPGEDGLESQRDMRTKPGCTGGL
ncbi:kinase-like protein [Teratosphaeria destructans]|uniref:Kinase-like protein n=1 Tax=Teratosphaeria destructans TaxID=418781 RepID=A0A9W7VYH4_9PEZI|nr:kinase-like protein [Teratosphaeria destructans]